MYRGINNIIRQNCEDKCEIGNSEDSVKLLNIFRSGFLKIKKNLGHQLAATDFFRIHRDLFFLES